MFHNDLIIHKKNSSVKWLVAFIILLFLCTACGVRQPQLPSQSRTAESETAGEFLTSSSEEMNLSPLDKLERQADAHASSGDYRAALNSYNFLLSKYPVEKRGDLLKKIEPVLSKMKGSDLELVLKSDITRIPESMVLYQLGLSHAAQENYSGALEVMTEYVSKYPEHPNAQDARDMLNLLRNKSFQKHKIGCLLPLSGKFAVFGQKALKGVQMALRDLTPKYQDKITLIIKDTESSDEKAVQCVQELAEANVSAIAGPMVTAAAAAEESQEQMIPMICMTQKSRVTDTGDYVFSNFLTPEMQVNALLNHSYKNLGVRRFAVLYPDDKYGTTYMNLFTEMAEKSGGEIGTIQSYNQDHKDFSGVVRKIARFVRSSKGKSAVFIPDSPSKLAMILPQFAYHNASRTHLLGTNIWHNDYLLKEVKGYVRNAVITEGFFARSQKAAASRFADAFHLVYGETPGFVEAIAYDTVSILIQTAMEPGIESKLSLKNTLAGKRTYEGVTGKTSFEPNGKAHKDLFFITVKKNQFIEIPH